MDKIRLHLDVKNLGESYYHISQSYPQLSAPEQQQSSQSIENFNIKPVDDESVFTGLDLAVSKRSPHSTGLQPFRIDYVMMSIRFSKY